MNLQIDSVRKNYKERNILSDVYLHLEPGQIMAFFGRNGEGKTTLFKLLVDLEPADQIFIKYGERVLKTYKERITVINYLPQHFFLPGNQSIEVLAKAFLSRSAFDLLAKEPPFIAFRKLKPNKLSGGERRVLELLFILYSDAPVLLLDEPFKNLDPKYQSQMQHYIAAQKTLFPNKAILITDHNYEAVLNLADRMLVLKDGQIKEVQTIVDLITLKYLPESYLENLKI